MSSRKHTEGFSDPIAIVGMAGRFPGGADSPDALWEMLIERRDGIVDVPEDRWDVRSFYDPDPEKPGKMYVRKGGFLTQPINRFDALFFGISPREAVAIDPQQRLLLEVSWEAIEDAGLSQEALAGSDTGVYVGAFTVDSMLSQMSPLNRDRIDSHTAVGSTMTILSNRLSYVYDLHGPSMTIDTACSSSMVALHQACKALWREECQQALVGGVNIMSRPENPIAMCKGQFLAKDGRCKSFDARADGYGRGEGAGVLVLKRLSRARNDGDRIHAVIRGIGVNQDGRTDGITVPNPKAQEKLIRRVLEEAGVEPGQISYVEAHGTGTPAGDPRELRALGAVVGAGRTDESRCPVGSVKASTGHLEAASGMAGMIKSILCLQHELIPPQANLETVNPNIALDDLGLRIATEVQPLPKHGLPPLVIVNSFGYGGTNATVLLQQSPVDQGERAREKTAVVNDGMPRLLPISARSSAALKELASAFAGFLEGGDAPSLDEVCSSALVRRYHHNHRLSVVGEKADEMVARLRRFAGNQPDEQVVLDRADEVASKGLVFVFTGMGPQWWRMGRELLEQEPVYRESAERIDRLFLNLSGWSLLEEMGRDEASSRVSETQIAQPANFLLQASLVDLWRARGIVPDAVVGHSVGEVTAAYATGALTLEEAVRVSYERSRVQKKAAGTGAMLAVSLSETEALEAIEPFTGRVSVAAINSPGSLTLAGEREALEKIAAALEARGTFNRFLQVEVPYHSPQMDGLKPELRRVLAELAPRAPRIPLYSTVTGERVEGIAYDAEYWCDNVRNPVRFAKATDNLVKDGYNLFLEVGPHPVLATSIKECLRAAGSAGRVIPSLRRGQPERVQMTLALGALYNAGWNISWRRLLPEGSGFVRLPSYPWQRELYWTESQTSRSDRLGQHGTGLLGRRLNDPAPKWELPINRYFLPYLEDHRVQGAVVLPGAAYVEAGLAVARELFDEPEVVLENLRFSRALVVAPLDEPRLRISIDPVDHVYQVHSRSREDGSEWALHAQGRIVRGATGTHAAVDLPRVRARCNRTVGADTLYPALHARGLQYGQDFQRIREASSGKDEVLSRIDCQQTAGEEEKYWLHPTVLDACFQSLILTIDGEQESDVYVPVRIGRVHLFTPPQGEVWCHGRLTARHAEYIVGELTICDALGKVLAEVRDVECQSLAGKKSQLLDQMKQWTYFPRWLAQPLTTEESRLEGRWLVFADTGEIGAKLAGDLRDHGAREVIEIRSGEVYRRHTDGSVALRPADQNDLQRLMAEVDLPKVRGVVFAWGLDYTTSPEDPTAARQSVAALHAIQQVVQGGSTTPPRLYVLTRGAEQVRGDETNLAHAPLVGMVRVSVNEYPAYRCTLIDFDPDSDAEAARKALVSELAAASPELEVAFRGDERMVYRLERGDVESLQRASRLEAPVPVQGTAPYRVEFNGEDAPKLRVLETNVPGAGEMDLSVAAFDLGASLITGTDKAALPWIAVSASVAAVGDGITERVPGERLIALVQAGPATRVTVDAKRVIAVPRDDKLPAERQVAVLRPLLEAHYALVHLGRLSAGESLLIHAADEPAGICAAHIATRLGARVFAATSVPSAVQVLRELGVEAVIDASPLQLTDRVRELTRGSGVDLIFNAPTNDAVARSASLLAPFGRLLDNRHDRGDESVALPVLNPGVAYLRIDCARLMSERTELCCRLAKEAWASELLASTPLPVRSYPITRLDEAVAEISASGFGKSVVTLDPVQELFPLRHDPSRFDPQAAYLVTGGFGGFGSELAHWMVERGAHHLYLVGRRGGETPGAAALIGSLQEAGADVHAIAADISRRAEVSLLLDAIRADGRPLKGIMHAAGVLDDGLLIYLDEQRYRRVLAPKAEAAWYMHEATASDPLDHFVFFSSVTTLIGNPGQGNYVAANTFLDTLAHYRRNRGLAATSINWGLIADVGLAVRNADIQRHFDRMGIRGLPPRQAVESLEYVLRWNTVQVGVLDLDWDKMFGQENPRFESLRDARGDGGESSVKALRRELLGQDPGARLERVTLLLREAVAETLRLPVEQISGQQRLSSLGLDSLMAVELQAAIQYAFGVEITMLELMQGNSVAQMSGSILAKMGLPEIAAKAA